MPSVTPRGSQARGGHQRDPKLGTHPNRSPFMTQMDPGVHFRIDRGRRIIRILPEGDAPFQEILALRAPIREHPDFSPVFGRAWDLSAVTWEVETEHVTELFQADRDIPRHPHGGTTAIIVDLDVYQVMARSHPHRVLGKEGRVRRIFPSTSRRRSGFWLHSSPPTQGDASTPLPRRCRKGNDEPRGACAFWSLRTTARSPASSNGV